MSRIGKLVFAVKEPGHGILDEILQVHRLSSIPVKRSTGRTFQPLYYPFLSVISRDKERKPTSIQYISTTSLRMLSTAPYDHIASSTR